MVFATSQSVHFLSDDMSRSVNRHFSPLYNFLFLSDKCSSCNFSTPIMFRFCRKNLLINFAVILLLGNLLYVKCSKIGGCNCEYCAGGNGQCTCENVQSLEGYPSKYEYLTSPLLNAQTAASWQPMPSNSRAVGSQLYLSPVTPANFNENSRVIHQEANAETCPTRTSNTAAVSYINAGVPVDTSSLPKAATVYQVPQTYTLVYPASPLQNDKSDGGSLDDTGIADELTNVILGKKAHAWKRAAAECVNAGMPLNIRNLRKQLWKLYRNKMFSFFAHKDDLE